MIQTYALPFAAALFCASAASAQQTYFHLDGLTGSTFGRSIANAGDVDGDGKDDIAIGATGDSTGGPGAGAISIHNSNGGLIWTVYGVGTFSDWDGLGSQVTGVGDVNGDGRSDVLVTLVNKNEVRLLSGIDGTLLTSFSGGPGFGFGVALAGAGDVDGDMVPDFLIGDAEGDDPLGVDTGFATMYSGATFAPLYTVYGDFGSTAGPFGIVIPGDWFGGAIAAGKDLTGDGVGDFAVGAINNDAGGSNAGQVKVFDGTNGALLATYSGLSAGDNFGESVALFGDVDGDNKSELAIGAPGSDLGGADTGTVSVIFSGGAPLYSTVGSANAGDKFGSSLAPGGDINGDGILDFIVGAPLASGTNDGEVHLIDGGSGTALGTSPGLFTNDRFGGSVAGEFDVNGDGVAEYAASAQDSSLVLVNAGYVEMQSFVGTTPGSAYCFGDGSGANCPCSAFGASGQGCANTAGFGAKMVASGIASVLNDTLRLEISGVPGAKPGLILRGDNQIAAPAGDGILCTAGASQRSHVQTTSGGATNYTNFRGMPFGSISNLGAPTNFQFWYRDPSNPCSGGGFNFTNGWTVTYTP